MTRHSNHPSPPPGMPSDGLLEYLHLRIALWREERRTYLLYPISPWSKFPCSRFKISPIMRWGLHPLCDSALAFITYLWPGEGSGSDAVGLPRPGLPCHWSSCAWSPGLSSKEWTQSWAESQATKSRALLDSSNHRPR